MGDFLKAEYEKRRLFLQRKGIPREQARVREILARHLEGSAPTRLLVQVRLLLDKADKAVAHGALAAMADAYRELKAVRWLGREEDG